MINQLRFGRTLKGVLEACQPLVPNPLGDSGKNRREKLERPNRVRVQPDGHRRTQVRLVEANRPLGRSGPSLASMSIFLLGSMETNVVAVSLIAPSAL